MSAAQDFDHTYRETLRVRLLPSGRVVLTDCNGLRAMSFQYHGSHDDRNELINHVDAAIVDAMLAASLPYDASEDRDFHYCLDCNQNQDCRRDGEELLCGQCGGDRIENDQDDDESEVPA